MLISNVMKKFLLKIALFLAILLVLDRLSGFGFAYLSSHAKGGYTEHFHYLTEKIDEDILVFGSSRALHHYNPEIIEDSLKLSCYNCGQDGNGILLFYGWWKNIKKHHHPKMIIYDISPSYDLCMDGDNHKYLGWLKELYDNDDVKNIFMDVDKTERFKMMSQMYRYNSKFHQIIGDYIYPVYKIKKNGYMPLKGNVDPMRIRKDYSSNEDYQYDELKIKYLQKLIDDMNGTNIVFVYSPIWYGNTSEVLHPLLEICDKKGIPVIDFSNEPKYVRQDKYFKDGTHLNAFGADEFTNDIVRLVRSFEAK